MWQDVRYAARRLTASPLFSAAAVITVAVGVGLNAAVFALLHAALFRALPYPHAERIIIAQPLAPAMFLDWARQADNFDAMAAFTSSSTDVAHGGSVERVEAAVVSGGFFDVAGVSAALGRTLRDVDAAQGLRVAVIGDAFWRGRLGGDPDVLGRKLQIDGEPTMVVGVMPPGFRFPYNVELWIPARHVVPAHPLRPFADATQLRSSLYLGACGRLKPDRSVESATLEQRLIFERARQQYPAEMTREDVDITLTPLRTWLAGDLEPALLFLMGGVAIVLLTVCLNLANLLLARSAARQTEMAIRSAIGASSWRIARQMLIESSLLSVIGGVAAVVLAAWAMPLIVALVPELRDLRPAVGVPVWLFAVAASVSAGLLFGAPAIPATRTRLGSGVLNGRTVSRRATGRAGSWLLTAQFAFAFALIVSAALLYSSVARLLSSDVGFAREGLQIARVNLPPARYTTAASQARFFETVLTELRTRPGIESVAAAARLPFSGADSTRGIVIDGADVKDAWAGIRIVSPGYFRVLGVPVTRGRPLNDADTAASPPAALVNQTMSRRYWNGASPIGRRFRLGADGPELLVVGEVADTKYGSLRDPAEPEFYVSFRQLPWTFMTLVIKSRLPPPVTNALVTQVVMTTDPNLTVSPVQRLTDVIRGTVAADRLEMLGVSLFGTIALALAALGLYGVTSYLVAGRAREIGIRIALGAERGAIVRHVMLDSLGPIAGGTALGILLAAAAGRILQARLFGVSAMDASILSATAVAVIAVGLAATTFPARRASRVDPIAALRSH